MKKILLVFLLFLSACSSSHLPSLRKVKYYSDEKLNELLLGLNRAQVIESWGEPDFMCSGEYCDFYDYDKDKSITIYYDSEDNVYEVHK